MKTNRIVVRTLFLIALVCSLGLQAFGSRVPSSSCRVHRHPYRSHHQNRIGNSSLDLLLPASAQRTQAHRHHRLRGKRINLDTSAAVAPALTPRAAEPASVLTLHTQHLKGPNPPRGPPSISLL